MRHATLQLGATVLIVILAHASLGSLAQVRDRERIQVYLKSLLPVAPPAYTVEQASTLAAWPLSCMDHPQPSPEGGLYLWQYDAKPRLEENYDKTHAFYSCYDWHSAVNSSWTMVALLKDFPDLPLAKLLHEKVTDHLGAQNVAGEVSFFKEAKGFEKPYGYAWLLKLDAEIKTWNDPAAAKLVTNLQPLVDLFSAKLVEFFDHLPYASRSGVHPNTALSMTLVLDYTSVVADPKLQDAVLRNAKRLFANDERCPTWFEPGGTEFLSPCLAEAQLMSHTMDRIAYARWLDRFLPAVYSPDFQSLIKRVEISGLQSSEELAGKSHLIGLAFHRAFAMTSIADALPPDDPRVAAFRILSAREAASGFSVLTDAGYMGSHWLGTYAVLYLRASRQDPSRQPAVSAPVTGMPQPR